MTVESSRILGAVAACLIAVGVVSQVAGVVSFSLQLSAMDLALLSAVSVLGILSFVGFILYLVAMHASRRIMMKIEYSIMSCTGLLSL